MEFLQNKNILVTGATGLVGTNVLARLATYPNVKIQAVCHTKEPRVFSDNISYVKVDLKDFEGCKRIVKDVDYVLMFAAEIARRSPNLEHIIANLKMNSQMLEAAYQAGVKKFLWLSSATAYPPSDKPTKEEQMFDAAPCDAYFALGWMTRYIETMCETYATKLSRKMTTIALRPTTIYGEYGDFNVSTCHVLSAMVRKVVERQNPLEIWGTGETRRDFIYVGDVVDACFLTLEKLDDFATFNIGSGKTYSVNELLEIILDIENYTKAQIVHKKSDFAGSPVISVDCTKAREIIAFDAKVSIREGINRTIEWFKDNVLPEE